MRCSESSTHAIERREALNHTEFIERYCRPRRPVILTDAIYAPLAATFGLYSRGFARAKIAQERLRAQSNAT
jgi:hypothetical protein